MMQKLTSSNLNTFLFLAMTGGLGFGWFQMNGMGERLLDKVDVVATIANSNTIILGEVRKDVATLVEHQGVSDTGYKELSDRVLRLEGLASTLKEQLTRLENSGRGN